MKILFVDLTAGHDPNRLYDKPTGGTLTSLTKIPELLVKHGHEVYVRSSYEKEELVNGVQYLTHDSILQKWDVVVFNRNVLPYEFVSKCKEEGAKIVWWLHDIVDTRYLPDATFTLVDHIVALSKYCKETFSDFYEIPKDKFNVISNGIDPEVFNPGEYDRRNPHTYIVASAPIKGYAPIPMTYENLKKQDPDLDFRIYSSQTLHGKDNSPGQQQYLNFMGTNGAHMYAPVNPRVLAAIMKKAWALLMPNNYPEICSNLLIQARACGLPVVTSNIGANPEFIEHEKTGLLTTKWHPHDMHAWSVEFTREVSKLQQNKELHKQISEQTSKDVPTWEEIGGKWNECIQQLKS